MSSYAFDIDITQIFICCLFHTQSSTLSETQQAGKQLSTSRFFLQAQYPAVKTLFIPRGYMLERTYSGEPGRKARGHR